jgi:hypothetical protein
MSRPAAGARSGSAASRGATFALSAMRGDGRRRRERTALDRAAAARQSTRRRVQAQLLRSFLSAFQPDCPYHVSVRLHTHDSRCYSFRCSHMWVLVTADDAAAAAAASAPGAPLPVGAADQASAVAVPMDGDEAAKINVQSCFCPHATAGHCLRCALAPAAAAAAAATADVLPSVHLPTSQCNDRCCRSWCHLCAA